jgi:hypothetical protein
MIQQVSVNSYKYPPGYIPFTEHQSYLVFSAIIFEKGKWAVCSRVGCVGSVGVGVEKQKD